ncbi:MAG: Trk system potassium transporter TrkA [Bacteroidales bacterium]|nr:Trk system potassium transporter TrkA [Bacteroidales bacterium]
MNIIIAGDGEVGFYLAKSLTELKHNITVVDPHSALLRKLEKSNDLLTIAGDSTSPRVLEEAGTAGCDLFLSVLHDESINLVSCILAKKLKAKKTVARISNAELLEPRHRTTFRELGIDELVCPERIAAKEITNLLNHNVATEFFDFSGGLSMYLIRLRETSQVIHKKVKDLIQIYNSLQVRIVAVLRAGETLIPDGDFEFQTGDLAYIISRANQMENIQLLAGDADYRIRNVMVVGGGRIGRYAALTLEDQMHITLVEQDPSRCLDLSELLHKTLVINGDATDIELLKEEGLQRNDAFIAVTDSSETNVLTCLHARRLGIRKTIALVENTGFIDLSQQVGIDTIVNKKLITASYIARLIVRGSAVRSKWLSGTNAELIEFIVGHRSKALRSPLGQLRMPQGSTVGGIVRGEEGLLPYRDMQLMEGDKVVVFAMPEVMDLVARIFD